MLTAIKNLFKRNKKKTVSRQDTAITYSSEINTSYEELASAGLLRSDKAKKVVKRLIR